ncbi:MAG: SCO family protein, partial [Microthrixaceae bacterium]
LVLAVLGLGVLLAAGALVASRSDRSSGREDWVGTVLGIEQTKPEITLTDTAGDRFDLADSTDGQLTLLMFGYTNCPDICPISVATLASALDSMDPAVARKVRLVFVTADPERDTPERLRTFLDQFDERFIGLTGTLDELDAAQDAANVPIAVRDEPDEDGSYAVGHATQMIAYQSDGVARIVYPFGTREGDWVRDLPRLVAGEEPAAWPRPARAEARPSPSWSG